MPNFHDLSGGVISFSFVFIYWLSSLSAHKFMKRGIKFSTWIIFSALQAKTFHAKVTCKMITKLSLLNHLVAMRAHLNWFTWSSHIINFIQMFLAWLVPVPGLLGEVAEFIGTRGAWEAILISWDNLFMASWTVSRMSICLVGYLVVCE